MSDELRAELEEMELAELMNVLGYKVTKQIAEEYEREKYIQEQEIKMETWQDDNNYFSPEAYFNDMQGFGGW